MWRPGLFPSVPATKRNCPSSGQRTGPPSWITGTGTERIGFGKAVPGTGLLEEGEPAERNGGQPQRAVRAGESGALYPDDLQLVKGGPVPAPKVPEHGDCPDQPGVLRPVGQIQPGAAAAEQVPETVPGQGTSGGSPASVWDVALSQLAAGIVDARLQALPGSGRQHRKSMTGSPGPMGPCSCPMYRNKAGARCPWKPPLEEKRGCPSIRNNSRRGTGWIICGGIPASDPTGTTWRLSTRDGL